jgi:hypothetical protein
MTKGSSKKPSPPESGQELKVGPLTQLLIKARARILSPERWARGAYARNQQDQACNVQDPTAVRWCAVGTLEKECGRSTPSWSNWINDSAAARKKLNPLYGAAHALLEQAAGISITALNDGIGHARVIQMYNQAIKAARGK